MVEIHWGTITKHLTKHSDDQDYLYGCEMVLHIDDIEENPDTIVDVDILTPIAGIGDNTDIKGLHCYPPIGSQGLVALVEGRWVLLGLTYHPLDSNKPTLKEDGSLKIGNNFIEIKKDTEINITIESGKSLTINVSGGGTIELGGNTTIGLSNHTHAPPVGFGWKIIGDSTANTGASSSNSSNLKGG